MIDINLRELGKVLLNDETQMNCLYQLAEHRAKDSRTGEINEWYDVQKLAETYAKNGIFYLPPNNGLSEDSLDELDALAEELGKEFEDWGVNAKNEKSFKDGFMIPVTDMNKNILFYINNNFERPKEIKYINVYTDKYDEREKEMKVFGMDTALLGLKKDAMVYVEGVYDKITLATYDIPVSAFLGTSISPYAKNYVKRFKKKIYVGDNDYEGERAWKNFERAFPDAVRYPLPSYVKDVDEFEKQDKVLFNKWLEGLKALYE